MTPQALQELIMTYDAALQQGQISKEEYMTLLQGIDIMEGIGNDAESLQTKEQLNMIINAAISAASLLA
jgi:predicted metal-binding transcription factor (methanogenesis marker protein 9)